MPTQQYRTKNGKRVPGVTTVLNILNKPALIYWGYLMGLENYNRVTEGIAKIINDPFWIRNFDVDDLSLKIGLKDHVLNFLQGFQIGALYEKRDKAAEAGTLGHLFVENHLKGLPDPDTYGIPTAIVKKAEGAYIAFLEWEKSHDFRMVESEIPLVSEAHGYGGTIDIGAVVNQRSIVDIKTSKDIYFTMWVQLSAYGELYNENRPEDPVEGYHILRIGEDGSFDHKFRMSLGDEWGVFLNCLSIYNALQKLGKKL